MVESAGIEGPTGPGLIAWGVAKQASPGEAICGDRSLVKPFAGGVLVAVVDGLGHGQEAGLAAQRAITTLETCPHLSPIGLVTHCHQELKHTRGAVMGLAIYNGNDETLTWLGVGNLQAIMHRADRTEEAREKRLGMCRGVVGYQLPPLRAEVLPVRAGDTLIVATDGIRAEFAEQGISGSPQEIADRILSQYAKGMDDALVLAARYQGAAHDASLGQSGGTI
jgi:phosphoserine phosphatase RsbX